MLIITLWVDKMKTDNKKNVTTGFIPPACPQDFVLSAAADRRAAGFTLVEVVIAMALLILSLSAFAVSFVQSRRSAAIADNRLDAIHTARDKMETLGSYLYTAPELSAGPHNFLNGFYTISNNTAARVKDIVVTINWVNPLGKVTSTVSLAGSVSSELHQ